MRVLGVDYNVNKKLLSICVTDNVDGNMSVVKVENIEDVISEKQAIKLCKQLYKKFDCDKMLLEENLRI